MFLVQGDTEFGQLAPVEVPPDESKTIAKIPVLGMVGWNDSVSPVEPVPFC